MMAGHLPHRERPAAATWAEPVDVLVPCAGDGRYVAASLRAIQAQTHREFTVFVIDNACPHDVYRRAVEEMADHRFRYVRHELRLPMTANWQRCLGEGQSAIYAMLHDDDVWPECYLETALQTLFEDRSYEAVMTPVRTFEGVEPSAVPPDPLSTLAVLGGAARGIQRVAVLFSFLGHMSAFVGRRAAHGYQPSSWWCADQLFIDVHWVYGEVGINRNAAVAVRRHGQSLTRSLMADATRICEARARFRQNAMEIMRSDSSDRYDIEGFVRIAEPSVLSSICHACLMWPPRPELHGFARRVLDVSGTRKRLRASGFRGWAVATLPFRAMTVAALWREGLVPLRGQ